jgi:glycosyltransferase involved in cell wall biosynthesis
MMEPLQKSTPIVFIDDAHTFGGTQIALAWTIRLVLLKTDIPVLCICTPRTRAAIEAVNGEHPRLQFEEAPSALPLNIFTFPLRLPAYWFLLQRIRQGGVRGWWLNLANVEFCLAPLLVLRAMGENTHAYIHGTGRFAFFHRGLKRKRRLLSFVRDAVANRFVFRLHHYLITASRASQAEVESRITSRKPPYIGYLYCPPIGVSDGLFKPEAPSPEGSPIQLWMIGSVIQGHKNNLAALDVLEELARNGYPAMLTVAGTGSDLKEFENEAERRNLVGKITYLGWLSDPCSRAPKSAILLIPSFHETMNLVAREAMRYGLRLVTSPIPVFHEWIPASLIAADFSATAFAAKILEVGRMSAEELEVLYRNALDQFSDDIFIDDFLRYTNMSSMGA